VNIRANEILNVALDFGDAEVKVGRMAQRRHQISFEYDGGFLNSGIQISPLRLPLKAGLQIATYQPFEGLFGVFNDSLPDGWGRLLLDRALAARGIAPQVLTALDRLAYVGRHGMGALVYYPEIGSDAGPDGELDLNALADEMIAVLEGEASNILDQLYFMGGSSAGARPKIMAGFDPVTSRIIHGQRHLMQEYSHWLIKFPSSNDQKDIALIEAAYAQMAQAAGIEMMETKVFEGNRGRKYFGTKRFDRARNRRIHMHTATGLLHSDHKAFILDYEQLMRLALILNRDHREAEKLFRLAAFNVLAHNRDDHGKNFSFLMNEQGDWRFAPAYDLTFSAGPGGEHSTLVMGEGKRPTMDHLLRLGEKFSIKDRKAILDEVREAVNLWGKFAGELGVSKESKALVEKTIAI
jgi:serine/threonine-protein kinase HipA